MKWRRPTGAAAWRAPRHGGAASAATLGLLALLSGGPSAAQAVRLRRVASGSAEDLRLKTEAGYGSVAVAADPFKDALAAGKKAAIEKASGNATNTTNTTNKTNVTSPTIPPAATPEPPPPPPPETPPPPLPPKFPVASPEACKILEMAIIVDPPPRCYHAVLAANWDACQCTIDLPPSINPQPNTLFDPYALTLTPDPDVPTMAPVPTLPPPSNPLMPYNAPMMVPSCPYKDPCGPNATFDCVGYDTWGFSVVQEGGYQPASRFFNNIICSYIMKPYDSFKVPEKVQALFRMQTRNNEVLGHYKTNMILRCKDQSGLQVISNSWGDTCQEQVFRLKVDCGMSWSQLWTGSCAKAPPPDGFQDISSLGELCPLECGFRRGELKWPYPLPTTTPPPTTTR